MILQRFVNQILQMHSVNASLATEKFYESLLAVIPGGLSIATDASCERIIHNPRAAQFLRIKEYDSFFHSTSQPPPLKVLNKGKELSPNEMPIWLAANNNEQITAFELEFIWEDGVSKTSLWTASPFHNEDGDVAGVIASFEEITQQKQTEALLRKQSMQLIESEERYLSLFENSPDAILLSRLDGTILDANPAGCCIFGRSREEICTLGRSDVVDINDIRTINAIKERVKTDSFNSELTCLHKDGTRFQAEVKSTQCRGVNGEMLATLFIRDISERKQAEETLRQSEEKFSKAFHGGPIMMTLATIKDGKFIDANEALCSGTGYARDELVGHTTTELNFFVDTGKRQDSGKRVMEQGKIDNAELDFRTKSGEIRNGLCWSQLIYVDGKPCHITGLIDVTEKKLIQQELADQMQELSNQAKLLNLAHDYIMVRDKNSALTFWNKSAETGYGLTKQEALGRVLHELLNTQYPTSFNDVQKELLSKGSWQGELIHTKKDGARIIVDSHQSLIRDKGGKIVAILEINRDITERKRMEETIRNNDLLFETCFDNMLDCIDIYTAVRDETGRIMDFRMDFSNKASCLLRNKTKEELIGKSYLKEIDNSINTKLFYQYCKVVETGEPWICNSISINNRFLQHPERIYDYRAFKYNDSFVLTYRDITKQKKMEREIARLDRLNLVGQMAAGIGHEVRNPMTTVRGFLQLLGSKEECSIYKGYFTLMIDEIDRANSIITEFLSLAKNRCLELKLQNLKRIVNNLIPLIQSDATVSDKYIRMDLEEVVDVPLDQTEINQLIINLVRNGLQAILPGGTLAIRTFMDKEEIVLAVQDNGEGIAPEVLDKIGIPFFTTKENGTGLGLAICYSIADRHNARIEIETGPLGTTFFVRFNK